VRQVVPREEWDAATARCPACGDAVDLRGPHYQVELDRERAAGTATKLTRERRLLSFCDEACANAWLDGGEHR
jgi:tRNA G26 N,N-dimethylase Trm1